MQGICLLKTSYTHGINILLIFINGEFLHQAIGLCYTVTTLELQMCLYTCFGTCVILFYSSSVNLEERLFRVFPFQ